MARDRLGLLCEGIEALADDDVHGRSLAAEIVELTRLQARLDAQIARRVVAFDHRGECVAHGSKSTAAWMIATLRSARNEAYRHVHVARDVEALPEVEALWQAGAISTRHVETIVKIRRAAKADVEFAAFESAIAQVAVAGTPDDIARVGQQWRHALDDAKHDVTDTLVAQQWEKRGLQLSDGYDGLGFIEATVDASDMTVVRTAMHKERERLRVADDERSHGQQLADAFVSICRQYLAGLPTGSNRPHVIVAVDLPTLKGDAVGRCETEHGTRLSPDAARRIACDANITRVLIHGDAIPLELGRTTRLFSADQRKALIIRDGRCRFPGCRRPPDQCEAHHANPWEHGGCTDLDNGGLLCWEHHRFAHEGKWAITVNADLSWTWHSPDRTCGGTTTPRTLPLLILLKRAA